jgi:hypothetical protein
MTRAPELAPSWLPRQQRRHIDRALRKLFQRDACSLCGESFKHYSATAAGFDAQGNVVLAGGCCASRVATVFGMGLYIERNDLTGTDNVLDDIVRRGGGAPVDPKLNLRDSPWKSDDVAWFTRNPRRSHRVRMPLPGEADKESAETPAGQVLIVLVRQVEPSLRIRAVVGLDADLNPVPDDEAVVYALFEAVMGREPMPASSEGLRALIEKYRVVGESNQ